MKLVGWINKRITHSRDILGPPVPTHGDYGIRVVIHFLAMFALIPIFYAHWSLLIAFTWLFLKYQRNEDLHTADQAWKDIAGALTGLPAVTLVICLLVYGFGIIPWYA